MPTRLLSTLILALSTLSACVDPQTTQPRPARVDGFTTEYLTRDEALRTVFPDAAKVLHQTVILSQDERRDAEILLRKPLRQNGFQFYFGVHADGELDGFAVIHEEIGKFKPITFIVGVEPDGGVRRVAVMVYRESRGGEVAYRRFLGQYLGKNVRAPISINRDILNITGATMSVNSMSYGVKKILSVVEVLYRREPERLRKALTEARPVVKFSAPSTVESSSRRRISSLDPAEGSQVGNVREARWIMGSLCEIEVWGPDRRSLRLACRQAFDAIEAVDHTLSDYRHDSELSRLSRQSGGEALEVSTLTAKFLQHAARLSRESDGAFDVTVGPVVDAWGLRTGAKCIPSVEDLRRVRPLVDYRLVEFFGESPFRVRLAVRGMRLDPGALGKGFAVDCAVDALRAAGVESGLVNFSGNIYALGAPPGCEGWTVAVRDPQRPEGVLGFVQLRNEAISSSGGYEKYIEIDGQRFGHLLSPQTLRPISAVVGVTVRAPDATLADGWSTAAAILGEESIQRLNLLVGIDGLIVLSDSRSGGRPLVTDNWTFTPSGVDQRRAWNS